MGYLTKILNPGTIKARCIIHIKLNILMVKDHNKNLLHNDSSSKVIIQLTGNQLRFVLFKEFLKIDEKI